MFKSLGKKASGEKCDAIEGLIKALAADEGSRRHSLGCWPARCLPSRRTLRDRSLREWAKDLGHYEAHKLVSEILDQEKTTNNKLTNLAVTPINKTSATAKAA